MVDGMIYGTVYSLQKFYLLMFLDVGINELEESKNCCDLPLYDTTILADGNVQGGTER